MDVEIEKPHVHHHPTGRPWFDLALPIAALFVSFVSIFIAWHHGVVMQELVHQNEKLVEANSLPYLQLYGSNTNGHIAFEAMNEGVGPAKVITAQVAVAGKRVASLREVIDACCKKGDYSGLVSSSLEGRMIPAGKSVRYIDMPVRPASVAQAISLDQARQKNEIVTRLCYCSVFDDCWIADSRDPTPDPVKECTPPAVPYRE
jgi:hypothetical protein